MKKYKLVLLCALIMVGASGFNANARTFTQSEIYHMVKKDYPEKRSDEFYQNRIAVFNQYLIVIDSHSKKFGRLKSIVLNGLNATALRVRGLAITAQEHDWLNASSNRDEMRANIETLIKIYKKLQKES